MKYRKTGNTNLNVSVICLGTMTFGEQNSQSEAFEQMDYAYERGINFFDTAEIYPIYPKKETCGKTEEISIGGFGMDTIITPLFSVPLILQISIFFFFAVQLLSILPIYLISRISITDELRSI